MIRRIIILLLIVGCVFGEDFPPKSVLQNMTYDEKLDLYNSKKITVLESFFDLKIGIKSPHNNKKIYSGIILSFSPFIIGALANKWNQEFVNFAVIGSYSTIGIVIYDVQKQKKLYNDKLYKEIFLINQ